MRMATHVEPPDQERLIHDSGRFWDRWRDGLPPLDGMT